MRVAFEHLDPCVLVVKYENVRTRFAVDVVHLFCRKRCQVKMLIPLGLYCMDLQYTSGDIFFNSFFVAPS